MMAYIGRKQCGCVVAAVVDDPHQKVQIAADVAAWIKAGLVIERVDSEYVRENFIFGPCPHEPKQDRFPLRSQEEAR